MAKTQTRKCVSISGETYERVSAHCKERGSSVSGFVETLVAEFFRNETVITNNVPEKEPPAEPFIPSGLKKKTPVLVTKDPLRGGGIHSL